MSGPEFINPHLTLVDVALGGEAETVISALLLPAASQLGVPHSQLSAIVLEREKQSSTVLPGGMAIPHGRIPGLKQPHLVFARLTKAVCFDPQQDPCDLVFLLLSPAAETDDNGQIHLKTLQNLVAKLMQTEFVAQLRKEKDPARISALLAQAGGEKSLLAQSEAEAPVETPLLLAVTSCPVGIAHTYMAADSLLAAAREMQVVLKVEAQGAGPQNPLDPRYIKRAQAVIFANDVSIRDPERFAHLPAVYSRPKQAIAKPKELIQAALMQAELAKQTQQQASDQGDSLFPLGGRKDLSEKDPLPLSSENEITHSGELTTDNMTGPAKDLGLGENETSPRKIPLARFFRSWSERRKAGHNSLSLIRRVQQAVMAGVSYMIPFVAAGGVLTALGLLISGYHTPMISQNMTIAYNLYNLPDQTLIKSLFDASNYDGMRLYLGAILIFVGTIGMNLMVPALSGYISFGLAGRAGIAPGFVGGIVSLAVGAGFIGALVSGIGSGLIAYLMGKGKYPPWLAGLMPIVLIPTLTSLLVSGSMVLFLGKPLRILLSALQNWLGTMGESSAVLVGMLLGAMMCLDLGGPVNKAAALFATAGLSEGTLTHPEPFYIMAATMCAGMVPPFATALATYLRPRWYTRAQREHAKASWLLGASFITEGAIPVAAADPFRVIPSLMVGGATAGGICMGLGVSSTVPHGGLFVLFAIDPWSGFLIALFSGVIAATIIITIAKAIYFYHHPLPSLISTSGSGENQTVKNLGKIVS